ncbi:MAG TPA: disulfide bond formation protein B [Gammaproteobacteria bacterium]|nr:disulfide bond formation protein B [Gammaproteobacteria bacterium]
MQALIHYQRWLFAAGVIFCLALLGAALYFQHVMGLEPCPLCIFQRIFVMVLGAVMLAAAIQQPRDLGRRVYGGLILIIAGLGAGVAGRHVWLQSLPPDQVPACGPGLEYLFETFPLMDALKLVLEGSGECAEVQWSLLGLSIPGWTLVVFTALAVFGLLLLFARATQGVSPAPRADPRFR